MKVVFLLNFLPAYRVSFFERLNNSPAFQLSVIHAQLKKEIGKLAVESVSELPFETKAVEYKEYRLGSFIIRNLLGALKTVRASAPDVLVIYDIRGSLSYWVSLLWARVRQVKVYIWACGHETQSRGSFAYRLKTLVGKVFFNLPNGVFVYSSVAKNTMRDRYGVPEKKITVCYNGLEIEPLMVAQQSIADEAECLRTAESVINKKVFLFVGGLIAVKRIELLIEAFAEMQDGDATLWIVGDGPEKEALMKLANECDAEIRLFGRVVDGVEKYFAACDFFVLPRLGGLALNQAMFWSKVCLCSTADGTEEDLIVDGETGVRFDADHKESLRKALIRAQALSAEARASMGKKARQLILSRSNVKQMVETFSSVLDGEYENATENLE